MGWTIEGIKEYKRNIRTMGKKLYKSTNYENEEKKYAISVVGVDVTWHKLSDMCISTL